LPTPAVLPADSAAAAPGRAGPAAQGAVVRREVLERCRDLAGKLVPPDRAAEAAQGAAGRRD
jgi:hypothetical protein